jgi:hypothetical protein
MTVKGESLPPSIQIPARSLYIHPSITPISFSGKETAGNSNGKNGKTGLFHL